MAAIQLAIQCSDQQLYVSLLYACYRTLEMQDAFQTLYTSKNLSSYEYLSRYSFISFQVTLLPKIKCYH